MGLKAFASPYGRRMPAGSRSSGTSTHGIAAGTPCGCGTDPASGSCSSPASDRGSVTNTPSSAPSASSCRSRRIRWRAAPRSRRRRRRSSPSSGASPGPTRCGWRRAPAAMTPRAPISIYEVHLASWLGGTSPSWDEAIERLIPYVAELGFTHIELMPIAEHPFGGSWGYQPLGLFAASSRYGTEEGFARFVNACHCQRHRRDPRLGARAFSLRSARACALRRDGALRASGPARGPAPGLGHADLQLRAP